VFKRGVCFCARGFSLCLCTVLDCFKSANKDKPLSVFQLHKLPIHANHAGVHTRANARTHPHTHHTHTHHIFTVYIQMDLSNSIVDIFQSFHQCACHAHTHTCVSVCVSCVHIRMGMCAYVCVKQCVCVCVSVCHSAYTTQTKRGRE